MFNLKQFVKFIAILFTVALIGEVVGVNRSLQSILINGPVYERIIAGKNLLADVLAPPATLLQIDGEVNKAMNVVYAEKTPEQIKAAPQLKPLTRDIAERKKEYNQSHQFWESSPNLSPEGLRLIKETGQQGIEYFRLLESDFMDAIRVGDVIAAENCHAKLSQIKDKNATTVEAIVAEAMSQSKKFEAEARASRANSLKWLGAITLGILLFTYGALFYFYRHKLGAAFSKIASNLELGATATALAAHQVAAASQTLSTGATEQASSVEETSASLEEMSAMIRATLENADKAKALSAEANASVGAGFQARNEVGKVMAELNASSAEVAKIVKEIDQIAFQTNILALNAAVEAARAGEAGAGFAVVANEVRLLAQRSAAAAHESAAKIEAAIAIASNGSKCSAKVGEALDKIAEKVAATDHLVGDITRAATEQAQGIRQLTQAISQMEKASQSNAASAEQSASAAEELSAQSNGVKQTVTDLQQLIGFAARVQAPRQGNPLAGSPPAKKQNHARSHALIPLPDDPGASSRDNQDFRNF